MTVHVYLYGYAIVVGCLYADVAVCGCARLCVWGFVVVAAPCACVYMGMWLCGRACVFVWVCGREAVCDCM